MKKEFSPFEKFKYYAARANDNSLSERQREYAQSFCLGYLGSESLIKSKISDVVGSDGIVSHAGYTNGFASVAKAEAERWGEKLKALKKK